MSQRPLAEHEIQRILALVPWLVAHPGVEKSEVASRFGISLAQLDRDLQRVLLIGVPPYTPLDYIDVEDDGDTITLRMAESFKRPLRLTHQEGLALLAAARTLLAVPGSDPDGPLATATAKLSRALGDPDLSVVLEAPSQLARLREAVAGRTSVDVEYWTQSRDEVTNRRIDPYGVYFALGNWYVDAYCHVRQDQRTFRVDRVLSVAGTDERFEVPDEWEARTEPYVAGAADDLVELELAPSARWVADHYPVERIEDADAGYLHVWLRVSSPSFLEHLAVRLGPQLRLIGPIPEGFSAARLARSVLDRYGAASP